jgi:hypothetical protein
VRRSPLVLAALLLATACAGTRSLHAPTTRGAPPGAVTPAFQGMGSTLLAAQASARAGDVAALKARHPVITRHGMGLLQSGHPHDLREADVPRYQEGRRAFGRALADWARAVEAGEDAGLGSALERLVDAYWGWVDAYKGLPPERSV